MSSRTEPAHDLEDATRGDEARGAARDAWRTVEIAPDAAPPPSGGYVELVLEDEPEPAVEEATRDEGAPAIAPAAAVRAAPGLPGRARGRRARGQGVLGREVAILLGALLAIGTAVAAFAPRAPAPAAAPASAPGPVVAAAAVPTSAPAAEGRGRSRPRPRTARVPAAVAARAADGRDAPGADPIADAPVPLDDAVPDAALVGKR